MTPGPAAGSKGVLYLATTYPVATETFVQREVEGLRRAGCRLQLVSIWRGAHREASGAPVWRMGWRRYATLPFQLLRWQLRRPQALRRLLTAYLNTPWPTVLLLLENLAGLACAVAYAGAVQRGRCARVHAVWLTGPAAAAWALHALTDLPYSVEGHAYDVFANGGDPLAALKLNGACRIRSSSRATAHALQALSPQAVPVSVVRRSLDLDQLPAPQRPWQPGAQLHLLSVGRFVPKMGFALHAEVLWALARRGVTCVAEVIGDGPERPAWQRRIRALGLKASVREHGALPFAQVAARLRERRHCLLFTGVEARDGDRAGLPNIVLEAMALGVPVVATPVGAVAEAIRHGETGLLARTPEALADALLTLHSDPEGVAAMTGRARAWVEAEVDAARNTRALAALLGAAVPAGPAALPRLPAGGPAC